MSNSLKIAILEDDPARVAAMPAVLRELLPAARAVFFENAHAMLKWLAEHLAEVMRTTA